MAADCGASASHLRSQDHKSRDYGERLAKRGPRGRPVIADLAGGIEDRSAELLHRWIELNAFTAVYRTHEGNQPSRNHQVDDDAFTLAHFARFARVYAALAPLRMRLGVEAAERGLPVVRHPWLVRPDDPQTVQLSWQFTLGESLWVAPVLDPATDTVTLYLPAGRWQHLWTDATLVLETGSWVEVRAPVGSPRAAPSPSLSRHVLGTVVGRLGGMEGDEILRAFGATTEARLPTQ